MMCVRCGTACGSGRSRGPRFTRRAAPAPMELIGTAGGVDHIPDGLIEARAGMLTYEDLFTGLGPDGQPAPARIPGTFGMHATRARLERY